MDGLLLAASHPANTPGDYVPILILLFIAAGLAASQLLISWVLGTRGAHNPVKDSPYECGIPSEGGAHTRFSVKFYLVAVLFILFDIEIVFLYPWAVHFGGGAADGTVFETRGALMRFLFAEMLVFLKILFLGWYWVVKKRALDWEES